MATQNAETVHERDRAQAGDRQVHRSLVHAAYGRPGGDGPNQVRHIRPESQSDALKVPPNNWGGSDRPPGAGPRLHNPQVESAKNILMSDKSSEAQKLQAIQSLSRSGLHDLQIEDKDGKTRNYTIQEQNVNGKRSMVHLFAKDDEGKNHVVLRGISKGDGTFQKEKDAKGNSVDYKGTWWSANMQERSGVGSGQEAKTGEAQTHPKVNPPGPDSIQGHPPRPDNRQDRPPQPEQRRDRPPQPDIGGQSPGDTPSNPHRQIDRNRFYAHQPDGISCGPTSLAMMRSDFRTGRPASVGEIKHLEDVTGTSRAGRFPGSVDDMARYARQYGGLNAKAYNYSPGDPRAMNALDHELDQGHGALLRVKNPHTGNNHWVYVAGKDSHGDYIVGDPDRFNNRSSAHHDRPVSRQHIWNMMKYRDGFVAGW